VEDQIIILMAEPAAVIPVIHGCPIATHFTFFPTFPFFFSSFFLLFFFFFFPFLTWPSLGAAVSVPLKGKSATRTEPRYRE